MKLLLLAGTAEARALSFALSERSVDLISSLAGVTERPEALGGASRVGGFGGAQGLADYLRAEAITHIIDATHPFAARMSRNAYEAAQAAGVGLLQLVRPAWVEHPSWTMADDMDHAAQLLPAHARVFLATGRGSLASFKARGDVTFLARVLEDRPGDFPIKGGAFLVGKPPFSLQEERKTLKENEIDTLVSRNSGGTGGIEKVLAAQNLNLSVVMVKRPDLPDAPRVETVEDALAWVEAHWTNGS